MISLGEKRGEKTLRKTHPYKKLLFTYIYAIVIVKSWTVYLYFKFFFACLQLYIFACLQLYIFASLQLYRFEVSIRKQENLFIYKLYCLKWRQLFWGRYKLKCKKWHHSCFPPFYIYNSLLLILSGTPFQCLYSEN